MSARILDDQLADKLRPRCCSKQVKNVSAFCLSSIDMAAGAASDGRQRFQFVKQKAAVYKITSFVRRTLTCRAACLLPPPPRCDTKFLVRTEEASFIFLPAAASSSLAAAASLTRKLYVLSSPFLSRKPRRQWLANCSSVALSFCGGTLPVTLGYPQRKTLYRVNVVKP